MILHQMDLLSLVLFVVPRETDADRLQAHVLAAHQYLAVYPPIHGSLVESRASPAM